MHQQRNTPDPNEWIEVRLADFYAPELNASHGPQGEGSIGATIPLAGDRPGWSPTTAGKIPARAMMIQMDTFSGGELALPLPTKSTPPS
jgi:hypothetical protein